MSSVSSTTPAVGGLPALPPFWFTDHGVVARILTAAGVNVFLMCREGLTESEATLAGVGPVRIFRDAASHTYADVLRLERIAAAFHAVGATDVRIVPLPNPYGVSVSTTTSGLALTSEIAQSWGPDARTMLEAAAACAAPFVADPRRPITPLFAPNTDAQTPIPNVAAAEGAAVADVVAVAATTSDRERRAVAERTRRADAAVARSGRAIAHDLHDAGNSMRLWQRVKCRYRVVAETGEGLYCLDGLWVPDVRNERVMAEAIASAKALEAVDDKFAIRSQNAERLRAAVGLLPVVSEGAARVRIDDLDSHADLLPVANGVLDLRTGERRDLDPDLLFTRAATVTYDPAATCPTIEKFIVSATSHADGTPDPEMYWWLQVYLGHCLSGLTDEQSVVFMHGSGSNGKGVLDRLMGKILGPFATSLPIASLVAGADANAEAPSPMMASLRGARWVTASESEQGVVMSGAVINFLSGGDRIKCRQLRQAPIEFTPTFKLTVLVNPLPAWRELTEATASRIQIVGLERNYKKGPNSRAAEVLAPPTFGVESELWDERSGFLNWLLEGSVAWYKLAAERRAAGTATRGLTGLPACARIQYASAQHVTNASPFASFLDEALTWDATATVRTVDLYYAYAEWCRQIGTNTPTPNAVGRLATRSGRLEFDAKNKSQRTGAKINARGVALIRECRVNRTIPIPEAYAIPDLTLEIKRQDDADRRVADIRTQADCLAMEAATLPSELWSNHATISRGGAITASAARHVTFRAKHGDAPLDEAIARLAETRGRDDERSAAG